MVRREQPFDGICSPQVFGPYFRSRRAALLENGDWSRALDEEFRKRGLETILEEAWVVSRGEGRVNRAAEPGLEGPGLSCKEEEESLASFTKSPGSGVAPLLSPPGRAAVTS